MFPEDLNVISPVSTNTASTEPSPVEQQHQRPRHEFRPSDPDRRASSQSLDGVMIRPEDYFQESAAASNLGATGMVRGLVEAGLNRVSLPAFIISDSGFCDTGNNTAALRFSRILDEEPINAVVESRSQQGQWSRWPKRRFATQGEFAR